MTEEEYQQDKTRRAELAQRSAEVMDTSKPTPTQEENDKLALGLLHPDEKANPGNPEMPAVAVQQAYLASQGQGNVVLPASRPPGGSPPAARAQPERSVPRTEPPKP